MIPYQQRFLITATIDENGYKELLKAGYSPDQIITYMKSNCKYVIDWNKISIPIKDLTIESDDDYDIKKKPLPMTYSGETGEGNDVKTIKPIPGNEYSGNSEKLPASQREW